MSFAIRRVLVDTSEIHSSRLEAYLRERPQNVAVLSEVSAFEPYKNGNLAAIGRNLAVCARYTSQIEILRGTSEIIALEAGGPVSIAQLVEPEQTSGFDGFCRLLELAVAGNADLRRQVETHAAAAADRVNAVRTGCLRFSTGVRALRQDMGPGAAKTLRGGHPFTSETVGLIWRGAMELAREMFLGLYPSRRVPSELSDVLPTFWFRFATASYLLALWWIRNGGIESVSESRLGNDLLDMQQIALASRYDGILTADARMQELYDQATAILGEFEKGAAQYPQRGQRAVPC